MSKMFSSSKATSLDLSSFDTSNVTNMYAMFYYIQANATSLDLSSFDTSNVTNMYAMFYYIQANAKSLDLSSFDTSNVKDMSNMFYGANQATIEYARTLDEATKLNNSSNKIKLFCKTIINN